MDWQASRADATKWTRKCTKQEVSMVELLLAAGLADRADELFSNAKPLLGR